MTDRPLSDMASSECISPTCPYTAIFAAQISKLPFPPPPPLQTIETKRLPDATVVSPDDEEVLAEENDDEFAAHFSRERPPHVLLTTSYKPTALMFKFVADLLTVFPHATFYKRQGFPLKKIVEYARGREFTDLVVINEDRKAINGMLVVHLPDGPTARFRLSNLTLIKDIKV